MRILNNWTEFVKGKKFKNYLRKKIGRKINHLTQLCGEKIRKKKYKKVKKEEEKKYIEIPQMDKNLSMAQQETKM